MYCFVVLILLFFFVCWPHTEPTGTESKLQYVCLNYAEAFYVVFMSCWMVAGKDSRVSSVQRFKLSEHSGRLYDCRVGHVRVYVSTISIQ